MYILSIAVPIFNMAWCLEKNLATYDDPRLIGKLEVICLNNASEDTSKEIIEKFTAKTPEIFRLIDRDSRGYGSSINEAISAARGNYFRIIDADDWVNTEDLIRQIEALENCQADVVLTDFQIVNLQDGSMTPVKAGDQGAEYGKVYTSFEIPSRTLPSIHGTTYRMELLRACGFYMQDKMFFVDEEYVILPYLSVRSVLYLDLDIYRYAVANPAQSTSPKNRAKYREHREKVLCRLIREYEATKRDDPTHPALSYCRLRIVRGIGDHFTTLLMYVEDRREGRQLAAAWKKTVLETAPELWPAVKGKAAVLFALNRLRLSLPTYQKMKKAIKG